MNQRIDQMLRWWAEREPERVAVTFLRDGVEPERWVTYADLDRRARMVAVGLQRRCTVGDRVVLAFGEGIEFVEAFFGCLYAGMIAVPAPPLDAARLKRSIARLRSIVANARPALILTDDPHERVGDTFEPTPCLRLETFDSVCADSWHEPALTAQDMAYLQYTSGSTTSPKGVMVTHGNVVNNVRECMQGTPCTPDSVSLSWMPNFHDFGLIYGILFPLYAGMPAYLATTRSFLKRPASWLEAISRHRVTHTGAATFAYDYCVQRITEADITVLDLSYARHLAIGAEPIDAQTILSFNERFASAGLDPSAIYPAYGQAEITGLATAKSRLGQIATFVSLPPPSTRIVVGCGMTLGETKVSIVEPDHLTLCGEGDIGEIWLRGPSVAAGYWNDDVATKATFGWQIAGSEEGPFLRTGDLGFILNDDVFVVGRLKHMLIVHGQNYYAEEIEAAVKHSHPLVSMQTTAVFGIPHHGREAVVVVQEIERNVDDDTLADAIVAIRRAVADDVGLPLNDIVFVKRGTLPRTTSGKVQRNECRRSFLDGSLVVVHHWMLDDKQARSAAQTDDALQHALIPIWQDVLGVAIRPDESFFEQGGTSLHALQLISEVELHTGKRVPDAFFEDPTVEHMARLLQGEETIAPQQPTALKWTEQDSALRRRFTSTLPQKLRTAPKRQWPRLVIEHGMVCLPFHLGLRLLTWWVGNTHVQRWFYGDAVRLVQDYLGLVRPSGADHTAQLRHVLVNTVLDEHVHPRRKVGGIVADEPTPTTLRGAFWKPFRQAIHALDTGRDPDIVSIANIGVLERIVPEQGCLIVTYHSPSIRFLQNIFVAATKRSVMLYSRRDVVAIHQKIGEPVSTIRHDPRPLAILLRQAQTHLEHGGVVVFAGDGGLGTSQRIPVLLFGRHVMLSRGFAELALRTSATIIPARVNMRGHGRWQITFEEPFDIMDTHTSETERVALLVRQFAAFYERSLAEDPASLRLNSMRFLLNSPHADPVEHWQHVPTIPHER